MISFMIGRQQQYQQYQNKTTTLTTTLITTTTRRSSNNIIIKRNRCCIIIRTLTSAVDYCCCLKQQQQQQYYRKKFNYNNYNNFHKPTTTLTQSGVIRIGNNKSIPTRSFSSSSSSSSPSSSTTTFLYTPEQKEIINKCYEIQNNIIKRFNQKWHGPLELQQQQKQQNTDTNNNSTTTSTSSSLPIVLLLGNHSSGKSTFCNYICGRTIQTAGVAPTDDNFTIIVPTSVSDYDQDGIALAGNPDLGFTSLKQFGPTLLHHTSLKVRTNIQNNFILIDSPGMIDAPGSYYGGNMNHAVNSSNADHKNRLLDRGYDFTGVVRWLADKADVVCLFFDPDKPGTTGETLNVLLHALNGMDHKLLIVLNKADQFTKIHDFARAYGTLCWNLSKVIPRKDLPKIYTMCLPTTTNTNNIDNNNSNNKNNNTIPAGLHDLHTARDEVVAEVFKAPNRRLDNIITELQYNVHQLHMHGIIIQDINAKWSSYIWQLRKQLITVALTGSSMTFGLVSLINNKSLLMISSSSIGLEYMAGTMFAGTILITSGLKWYHNMQLQEYVNRYVHNPDELLVTFQRTHRRSIRDGDEYIASIWTRIKDSLYISLQEYNTYNQMPTVTTQELQQLISILENDIPELRRKASPKTLF